MKIRINKYLSEQGYCSRRQADELIKSGKVLINDQKARLGDVVDDSDIVSVSGEKKKERRENVYIALHKPVGLICTTDIRSRDNVVHFINYPERIYPVGRLDVESSGLLLMTNDGTLSNRLMHPRFKHEKEYVVQVEFPLSNLDIGRLANGIDIGDYKTQKCKVRKMGPTKFAIILTEGKNQQIRRMVKAINNKVLKLKRTRIENVKLGAMKEGAWRHLTQKEIKELKFQSDPKNRT
ncbi:MAG: pseudouridine synthase [Patescibacteria group bacterium]